MSSESKETVSEKSDVEKPDNVVVKGDAPDDFVQTFDWLSSITFFHHGNPMYVDRIQYDNRRYHFEIHIGDVNGADVSYSITYRLLQEHDEDGFSTFHPLCLLSEKETGKKVERIYKYEAGKEHTLPPFFRRNMNEVIQTIDVMRSFFVYRFMVEKTPGFLKSDKTSGADFAKPDVVN